MPQESHEGMNPQELVGKFQSITTEAALRQFEKLYRPWLKKEAPPEAKEKFNAHWGSVVGGNYFVTITDVDMPTPRQSQLAGRIDPKSRNYQTERTFNEVTWQKTTVVKGKGLEKEEYNTYELAGTHSMGRSRIINPRCKPDRIVDHLGKKISDEILKLPKKTTEGIFKDIEIPVMVEGFWEVMFAGKANKFDKEDVELSCNGECLQMMREVHVILPGRYIEVNDHGRHPIFHKVGDEPRKIVGSKNHFPCTVMREMTKQEYDVAKDEGDRITQAARNAEMSG